MPAPAHRTYHYHANAHVLSAQFKRPVDHLIELQGATSLPTIGGHGNSRVENFRFKEFVTFGKGYSHVSGSKHESNDSHTTLVTSSVEDLNILDVVTADRVVARLASSHHLDHAEPRVTMVGTRFENLRIAGCPIDATLDLDLFERLLTFEDARKEFQSNADFRKMAEDPFHTGQPVKAPEIHGALLCSCVKEMKTTCPGVKRVGHAFIVPEFGKVFLGEVLFQHGRRTLTMIRLELGSPVSGTGTIVQATTNGQPYPPVPSGN